MPSLNDLQHAIDPIAFSCGPFQIHWYAIMYLVGFLIGGWLVFHITKRWNLFITVDDIFVVVLAIAWGIIIGGRLGYVLFYGLSIMKSPLDIFALNQGGMSFHGGLAGAILAGSLSCRRLNISILTFCDIGVIAAAPGIFLVRCANFINGELWGKPCDLPWAVSFASGGDVLRHPTQLYEALLEGLVMFCILYALARRRPVYPRGTFFGVFLVFYGIFRILVEFVREPDVQLGYLFGGITMGQLLTLPLIAIGVYILVRARKKLLPEKIYLDGYRRI